MRRHTQLLSAMLIFAASGNVRAEKGQTELTLEPGAAMPISTAGDYAGHSFELDASHFFDFHEVAAFGWEAGYLFSSTFGGTLPSKVVPTVQGVANPGNLSFSSDLSLSILHVTPEFKFGPTLAWAPFKVNPFLIGGGGLYWTHYQSGTLMVTGALPGGGTLSNTPVAYGGGNDVNGGFNVGGGLSLEFPQNWSVGAEVRYHHIYYGKGVNDTSYIVPSVRFSLLF
ncbi:MAG TPA: hypothetical protein VMU17_01630 [Elusimicrobiota bacterium]|nr:hypothetical protein [Elusimicrobiota bacterium]